VIRADAMEEYVSEEKEKMLVQFKKESVEAKILQRLAAADPLSAGVELMNVDGLSTYCQNACVHFTARVFGPIRSHRFRHWSGTRVGPGGVCRPARWQQVRRLQQAARACDSRGVWSSYRYSVYSCRRFE